MKTLSTKPGFYGIQGTLDHNNVHIHFNRQKSVGGGTAFSVIVPLLELSIFLDALRKHSEESFTIGIPLNDSGNAWIVLTNNPGRRLFDHIIEPHVVINYHISGRGSSKTYATSINMEEWLSSLIGEYSS